MRVRINNDITKPLLGGKMINIGSINPVWVQFSYERLLNFCYCCGHLGYGHMECDLW